MIRCTEFGKQISEDHVINCDACGAPFCIEYATNQLCSTCAELWESEIALEDMEQKNNEKRLP